MMGTVFAAVHFAIQALGAHPGFSSPSFSTATALFGGTAPRKRGIGALEVESLGPGVSAQSAVVIDAASGAILYGKRMRLVRPIASVTKLLTALAVVRGSVDWDAMVTITAEDVQDEGSIFRDGDRVAFRGLFTALLVRSDNGAAYAIARHGALVRGVLTSGYAQQRTAEVLGLTSVRVVDPAGLAPENRATAEDVARLLDIALREEEIRSRLALPSASVFIERGGKRIIQMVWSTNHLLRITPPRTFDGGVGKTGHIEASGYNVVVEAERDGHRIILAVLGSSGNEERFTDARKLAAWTFEHFLWE